MAEIDTLTRDERHLLCEIINRSSNGEGHPRADEKNLEFFEMAWVRTLFETAVKERKLLANGMSLVGDIRAKMDW